MNVETIVKKSFSVIGKEGQGNSNESSEWIPPLWKSANANFGEIANLAKKDDNGNMVGIWGAMSDIDDSFSRWSSKGKYLAGCEVNADSIAPQNWTKWVIPSYKYLVVKCTQESYAQTFAEMINDYIPNNNYDLVGAVHEFYNPQDNDGSVYLYFPIEKL